MLSRRLAAFPTGSSLELVSIPRLLRREGPKIADGMRPAHWTTPTSGLRSGIIKWSYIGRSVVFKGIGEPCLEHREVTLDGSNVRGQVMFRTFILGATENTSESPRWGGLLSEEWAGTERRAGN
jgi:hypothetical protein